MKNIKYDLVSLSTFMDYKLTAYSGVTSYYVRLLESNVS
jgi:hypothetical protein